MSVFSRKVGEQLRLSYTIEDSNEFVSVDLLDLNHNLIERVDLELSYDTTYTEDTFLMPNQNKITAIYKVYKDELRTEINECYHFMTEYYEKEEATQMGSSFGSQFVSGKINTNQTKIKTKLEQDAIKVSTSFSDKIIGVVSSEGLIKGKISKNKKITGEVINEQD